MTDLEKLAKQLCADFPGLDYEKVVERLERGVGSEALTGFTDREASGKTGGAKEEERSDEPQCLAVSPGLARASLLWAAKYSKRRAVEREQDADYARKQGREDDAKLHEKAAAIWWERSNCFLLMMPEPDSEQSENAGDGKPSQGSPEANAGSNDGTASGRRNH